MYVNAIGTDKKLEGVATVLFIIRQNNNRLQLGEVVDQFKNWSEDKAKRFSEDNILECVQYLEDTGIILKNILGLYQSV
jgi:hydrogenase maturation factor HypE